MPVYPRVGGATLNNAAFSPSHPGLSPRGRGNHDVERIRYGRTGSIPAWAGQPLSSLVNSFREKVYPRVGGATRIYLLEG